jgi:hypothetical protein
MGWGPFETRIEKIRAVLASSPRIALREIKEALEDCGRPRDRARLLALLCGARRHLRDWAGGEEAIRKAQAIPRVSRIAKAEIAGQLSFLRLAQAIATRRGWKTAMEAATAYIAAAPPSADQPRTAWGLRQERTRRAHLAAGYVTRGGVYLYGHGDVEAAQQDALHAAQVSPRYRQRRVHRATLAACSLLAACAVRDPGNDLDVKAAMDLIDKTDEHLPPEAVIPKAQLRAARACLHVRLGERDLAERLLVGALEELREAGAVHTYQQLAGLLVQLVKERDPEEASYVRRQLENDTPARAPSGR